MNSQQHGPFTSCGCKEADSLVGAALAEAARVINEAVPRGRLRSLMLIGGYGRGEGGVELREGKMRPHNNLDLLLITQKMRRGTRRNLRERIAQSLTPVADSHGIGMDLSVLSSRMARRLPCDVMWYDARHGHKTLLGDKQILKEQTHLRSNRINPTSMRDLLINRGTLLAVNQLLLEKEELTEQDRKTIVKHTMKAIIGHGDALLFAHDLYHWSYQERKKRMASLEGISRSFQSLYDKAIRFRFSPCYDDYLGRELKDWNKQVTKSLKPIHLTCETQRLRAGCLKWEGYPSSLLRSVVAAYGTSPRSIVVSSYNLLKSLSTASSFSSGVSMATRCCGVRDLLALTYPVIAYDLADKAYRSMAARALGAPSNTTCDMRLAYLRKWGLFGDDNFSAVATRLGLNTLVPKGMA